MPDPVTAYTYRLDITVVSVTIADRKLLGSQGHSWHQSTLTLHRTQLASSLRHMAKEERLPFIRVHWYRFNLTNLEKNLRKK